MFDQLKAAKIVPVASVNSVDEGVKMCEALLEAELPIVEITFRTAAAEMAIKAVSERFPEMLVGAGTILNNKDLLRAIHAGAKFAVAPGSNPRVIKAAKSQSFPFFPGVATPSDIEAALDMGCKTLKFFPAGALGGPATLKALCAPYAHTGVRFIPTGGISAENLKDYLALEPVLAVGGSWMVSSKFVKAGDWESIRELAREAVYLANK